MKSLRAKQNKGNKSTKILVLKPYIAYFLSWHQWLHLLMLTDREIPLNKNNLRFLEPDLDVETNQCFFNLTYKTH